LGRVVVIIIFAASSLAVIVAPKVYAEYMVARDAPSSTRGGSVYVSGLTQSARSGSGLVQQRLPPEMPISSSLNLTVDGGSKDASRVHTEFKASTGTEAAGEDAK
jgi:hypothetical protein